MTSDQPRPARHVLLICSVGGTPEPVAAAICHWHPARLRFLCSDQTRASIAAALDAAAATGGPRIPPGSTDQTILSDPQDLRQTLRDLRQLDPLVQSWRQRGDDYDVVVDFTGGTKVMSAALALVARRWKCDFAYVAGRERTKDGVGVVVAGSETPISQLNPWDALGYQAVEDAVAVFNHGGYAAAAALLDGAVKNAGQPEVKRELSTLKAVIDAYAAWDRFDHQAAVKRFDDALRYRNDLAAIFPHEAASLIARLERHRDRIERLAGQGEPTTAWVEDLLHNARRRADECRFDDAVARLYRAFEALAQVRLRERHAVRDSKAVPLERVPGDLRREWAGRARDGVLTLGLQDVYCLLSALGDELGASFATEGLGDESRSPLTARNQSILAHGFTPVGKRVYDVLHEKLLRLCRLARSDPPSEPTIEWRLPAPSGRP